MARVNIGVSPKYLADQHLIAESVEITVITGGLKANGYKIKSEIPPSFRLGTGHINFFKDKLLYLQKRLNEVNIEMVNRGFRPGTKLDLNEFPIYLINDWKPSINDTFIIRERIYERLLFPLNGKGGENFYRYYQQQIGSNIIIFADKLLNSELYKV